MLYINVNSIFFKSYSVDPISGHVIYVFDSTYLPSPEEVGDKQVYDLLIDGLMDKLVNKLPRGPFSLVVFSSGFSQKKISWVYGIKMFAKLPKELRAFLQKTYIVHESFFIRAVYQVLSNAMNLKLLNVNPLQDSKNNSGITDSNSNASMVHVSNLTELAQCIDITTLRISLNVYLHDYQFNDYIDLPPRYFTRLSSIGIRQYRQLIFDKIFRRLELEAPLNELIFQRPGSYKKVNILLDVIERNNYIDLSQWDIYSLGTVFLHFLKNKSYPLIPIDLIPLPIKDDYQYTYTTFCNIIKANEYFDLLETIFPLFIAILKATDVTKHNTKTLSKSLTPTLCQEKVSMMTSDRLAVGTRYIGNLIVHFVAIADRIDKARTGRSQVISPIRQKKMSLVPQQQQQNQELQKQEQLSGVKISGSAAVLPPPVPRARKSSPTKYGDLESSSIRRQGSPSRSASQISYTQESVRSASPTSTLLGDHSTQPSLKPKKTLPTSNRLSSDSSATLSDSNDSISSRSPSSSQAPESIIQMVTEDSEKDLIDLSEASSRSERTAPDINISDLPINDKFIQFDRNLQKKKQQNDKAGKNIKFSSEGYSDIKVGNKVGKLAALYEERLQGLQVISEMKKNSGLS